MLSVVILSELSYSAMQLAPQPIHHRFVQPGPLVLRLAPLKFLAPTEDRDRTVSRRSEPSSRTTLIDEQSNPWDLLQPQDVMSRHRGAKPPRRCELLEEISLLSRSTFYPLSDGPSLGTTGSLTPAFAPARLVSLAVKLPYAYTLYSRFLSGLREPWRASVTL